MAPNAPTEARHFDFPAARGATEIIGPDNGPREEQGDVPDLGPLHPSHHFNLRGAGPDHDEDEIGGYMQYVSSVSFSHRLVYRSPDRQGPRAPDPARPDSSGHAIRGSPELLGTINGAGAIRRNGPQAILARAGEGVASSQVPVARFQSGPHSGVSRVTVISGSRRTFRPGANIGPPDDPFQSAFEDILSHGPSVPPLPNRPNPRLDVQEGFGGPRFPGGISSPGDVRMDLSAILHHLLLTVHDPNAVHGDAVHSLEALDRIITSLMEDYPQSNAAPPASHETISRLPRKKLDEEMLGREIKGKCTVCIDDLDLSVYGSAFATALKSQRPIESKSPLNFRTSQGSIHWRWSSVLDQSHIR
ncbi:ubiquitin carboxyl-terminal hydrolase 16 [Apiospora arundinis]